MPIAAPLSLTWDDTSNNQGAMQSRCEIGLFISGMLVPLLFAAAIPSAFADDQPSPSPVNSPCAVWADKDAPAEKGLLGAAGGLRPALGAYGVNIGFSETSEVLGNIAGGTRRGLDYAGVTEGCLTIDLGKRFGVQGGTVNISAFQIHGRSITADALHSFQTASDIEADRTTRLWEAWYQQDFGDGFNLRIGQQSLDQEFLVSQFSGLFINAAMGWPSLPSLDLYAGGPAYPLSSLGARVKFQPSDSWTLLAGVFDDNPPGGPFAGDSQLRGADASGTAFNLSTGALFIAEAQHTLSLPGMTADQPLKGTYKLGAWLDTGAFADPRFSVTGLPLADPASGGVPRTHRGNISLYALADQTVWRADPRSVSLFVRAMGAPADRNLIDFAADAGVSVAAPFPGRDADSFGVAYGVAKVSNAAAGFDRDTVVFTGAPVPIRTAEHLIEITYQLQATDWCVVQPDLQFVFNPGGGIVDQAAPTRRIGNEIVGGVQTKITF